MQEKVDITNMVFVYWLSCTNRDEPKVDINALAAKAEFSMSKINIAWKGFLLKAHPIQGTVTFALMFVFTDCKQSLTQW